MFCSKCGNEVADGVAFCNQCGNKLGNASNQYVKNNSVVNGQVVNTQPIVQDQAFDEAKYQAWLKKDQMYLIATLVWAVLCFVLMLVSSIANSIKNGPKELGIGLLGGVFLALTSGCFIYAWHRIHPLRKIFSATFLIGIPIRAVIYSMMFTFAGAIWTIPALIKFINNKPTRTKEEYMIELAQGYIK